MGDEMLSAMVQMQFEGRKADLAMFKERAEALQTAVAILEKGIAASRAQVPVITIAVIINNDNNDDRCEQ